MSRLFGIRWWALSGAALAVGVLLPWLTYVRSEAVLDVARPLIDRDLPTLRAIAELKGRAWYGDRIARELYESTDRERFHAKVAEARRNTARRMQELRAAITDAEGRAQINHLQDLQRDTDGLFSALERELDSGRVNIGAVLAILGRISANSTEFGDRLDVLVSGVQSQAEERGEATRARLGDIIGLVAAFSALLVVAAAVISYFLSAYLREARERRRLALFPERNPNPVISLDASGALAYANPGALAMVAAMGLASPAALLPGDLRTRLNELRETRGESLSWEYPVGARVIGINIHHLEDSGASHVYLADVTSRSRAEADLRAFNAQLEERVAQRTAAFERANQELEAFSYSVSHDLRAPLRHIAGFGAIVLKESEGKLDDVSVDYLKRIDAACKRMGLLIDDLLALSRVSRQKLHKRDIDLSDLAGQVANSPIQAHPEREVQVTVKPEMRAIGDPGLVRIVLENLLENAWKFTARAIEARIEVGCERRAGSTVYFVRDNGAGFDMEYAHKLFEPFRRLHAASEFEGTGIGLSIVQRIVSRHGGRIWAEAKVGVGATFYFTLGELSDDSSDCQTCRAEARRPESGSASLCVHCQGAARMTRHSSVVADVAEQPRHA